MGIERLTKSIRKGIATGLLGLSAVGAGGCASTLSELTEGEGMTLLGAVMGASEDSSFRELAPYISLLGQMRHQKEVVREGRTQINVNPEEQVQNQRVPENIIYSGGKYFPAPGFTWADPKNPDDLTLRRSIGVALAANYWKDFDNDGFADPNEFVGVKDKFYDNESITLALYGIPGIDNIFWEIYGPNGEKIEGSLQPSTSITSINEIYPNNFTSWLRWSAGGGSYVGRDKRIPEEWSERSSFAYSDWKNVDPGDVDGGYGSYVVVWHSNGITETKQFEIVPSPKR